MEKRLFVDVDDTLVIYESSEKDFHPYGVILGEKWKLNTMLVASIIAFCIQFPETLVVIWSGGGRDYAEQVAKQIFTKEIMKKLIFLNKYDNNLDLIREGDIVIDDMASTIKVPIGVDILTPDEAPHIIFDEVSIEIKKSL